MVSGSERTQARASTSPAENSRRIRRGVSRIDMRGNAFAIPSPTIICAMASPSKDVEKKIEGLRDLHDVLRLVVDGHLEDDIGRRSGFGVGHDLVFRLGFRHLACAGQGQSAPEVPENRGGFHCHIGLWHFQNLIPMMEANLHRHRHGHEAFQRWHLFHVRADILGE